MENLANPSVLWVQGLPLLLVALFWVLCFVLSLRAWRMYRSGSSALYTNGKAVGSLNQLYKRAASDPRRCWRFLAFAFYARQNGSSLVR